MVLSSVCVDSAADWTQSFLQNSALKLPEDMIVCSRPLLDRRMKPQVPEQPLKCPRCDSTNTKFCYYNNYNLSQPRHFCKTCRRYWTKGGALRNVPVGGGCRKNKRAKRTIDHPISEAPSTSAPPNSNNELNIANCSPFDQISLPGSSSNPMYYSGNGLGLAFTRAQQDARLGNRGPAASALANCNNGSDVLGISTSGAHQSSLEPPSGSSDLTPDSLTTLSALNTLNSLKSNYPGLDFSSSSRDPGSYFQTSSQMLRAAAYVPGLFGLDPGVNDPWRLQRHLAIPFEDGQVDDAPASEEHAFLQFEDHTPENQKDQKPEVGACLPLSVKIEEENQLAPSEWPVASESALFEPAGDSGNYWNGGAWPDLTSYGSSGSPLI